MAESSATAKETGASIPAKGTTLRGHIEAIGAIDLLCVPVTQCSTGRLLVFNEQFDAELYYIDGHLSAIVSSSGTAPESLGLVLQMTTGEFEFTAGLDTPIEQLDTSLHDAMMKAVSQHCRSHVPNRSELGIGYPVAMGTSGVHRVSGDRSVHVSPIVTIDQPSETARQPDAPPLENASAAPRGLLVGERGRAIVDASGRGSGRLGTVSPREAALVILASKAAQSLASILGMRELQRFEIRDSARQALQCRIVKDSIHFSCVSDQADTEAVWRQLEP